MYVHEALAQALYDNGVRDIFGVVGDANLFVVESFRHRDGGRYVPTASECGSVMAAIGYAQVSGRLGVATVTHGPGLTNTLTALVEGVRGRIPLLVIAGDTPISAHDHIQDIDHRSVAATAGAGFVQVRSAESAVADVASAVRQAWNDALPVVLNVPIDLDWADTEYRPVVGEPTLPVSISPPNGVVEEALGVIASADRPLVLVGRGATDVAARSAVLGFAERIGAALATTLRGKDVFDGIASSIGVFGTLADEVALKVIDQADCVIAFGAGLNQWTTAEGALLDGKRVVHVDVDRQRLNRFAQVTVAVHADAESAAEAFVRLLDEADLKPSSFAERAAKLVAQRTTTVTDRGTDTTVDMGAALRIVDEHVPSDRVVVTDNGRFIKRAFTALHVEHPSLYAHAVNFGSIGLGMSTALGASYAAEDRPILLACGDGGFAEGGLSELVTMVMQRRNVIVLLLNDGAYGAEYVQLTNRGMDPENTTFDWPEFGPIAASIGAQAATVRNNKELTHVLEEFDLRGGPVLLDVRIDPRYA